MARLDDELKAYRCKVDADQFKDVIADMKNAMFRNWTEEDLLHHPVDAIRFCAAIRERIRNADHDMPDYLILSTMSNMRKASDPRISRKIG